MARPPVTEGDPREAIASGTPVVATPHGGLPETVTDGVTGYLVEGVEAMAEAIRRAPRASFTPTCWRKARRCSPTPSASS